MISDYAFSTLAGSAARSTSRLPPARPPIVSFFVLFKQMQGKLLLNYYR